MTNQPSLFDLPAGEARKKAGMGTAAAGHAKVLGFLRRQLEALYWERHRSFFLVHRREPNETFVTADDARRFLLEWYGAAVPKGNNNFLGSVFKDGNWEPTGEYVKSQLPGNNARRITCWRIKR